MVYSNGWTHRHAWENRNQPPMLVPYRACMQNCIIFRKFLAVVSCRSRPLIQGLCLSISKTLVQALLADSPLLSWQVKHPSMQVNWSI